jgi:hypothetical protein
MLLITNLFTNLIPTLLNEDYGKIHSLYILIVENSHH